MAVTLKEESVTDPDSIAKRTAPCKSCQAPKDQNIRPGGPGNPGTLVIVCVAMAASFVELSKISQRIVPPALLHRRDPSTLPAS
jgi:hypothetical protein